MKKKGDLLVFVAFFIQLHCIVHGSLPSHHSQSVGFSKTSFHGDLDCKKAFDGKGKPAYGGKVQVGLVHPHGPCSPIKELSHLSRDMPKLALEILRRDEEREKPLMKSGFPRLVARSLATGSASAASGVVVSGQKLGVGNFIMKVGVGTPVREFLFILDSGSDLAWTQCLPCERCYQQESPVFDPSTSSSYVHVTCATSPCDGMCSKGGLCEYAVKYEDNSSTRGDLGMETFSIGNATIQNYIFGCGHNNSGTTFGGVDGLLGLGRGDEGLPAQTVSLFGGAFAYCLPSMLTSTSATGFIEFGAQSRSSASRFTPMIKNVNMPSFYFVWLKAISLDGSALTLASTPATTAPTATSRDGTIVDSGTVITRLPAPDYPILRDAFLAGCSGITPLSLPQYPLFDTCFQFNPNSRIPLLTFHFDGLAFPLAVEHMLFYPSTTTACLAFAPYVSAQGEQLIIIGNHQMQGFLFTFDVLGSKLGIQTTSKVC